MKKCTAKVILKTPAICEPLVTVLERVPDKRSDQGKRFSLGLILCIVLLGYIIGKKSVEGCVNFALARSKWFGNVFDLEFGIPHATTISGFTSVPVCWQKPATLAAP